MSSPLPPRRPPSRPSRMNSPAMPSRMNSPAMPSPNLDSPAGPPNMNIFMDDEETPAWHSDIPLAPNPGLRGGPFVMAFVECPPLNIPLRKPSPEKKQVILYCDRFAAKHHMLQLSILNFIIYIAAVLLTAKPCFLFRLFLYLHMSSIIH